MSGACVEGERVGCCEAERYGEWRGSTQRSELDLDTSLLDINLTSARV